MTKAVKVNRHHLFLILLVSKNINSQGKLSIKVMLTLNFLARVCSQVFSICFGNGLNLTFWSDPKFPEGSRDKF